MVDLLDMFESLDNNTTPVTRDNIIRAPFAYPGGKSRSVDKILPLLPYRGGYVEAFGGSAAIMLARRASKLEVYNDRYGGVVAFYRCLRDRDLMNRLCDRLELTIHSREEFVWAHDTWEHDVADNVERAARWYYMTMYSFGRLGRNFGRSTSSKSLLASLRDKITEFPIIHERFKKIQVENQDWEQCVHDYDNEDTVFYLDPPYVDADVGIYKNKMGVEQHRHFINVVMGLKGFVAVSGYPNPLYDNEKWDDVVSWDVSVSIKSMAYTESNGKEHLKGIEERGHNTERLWIKEAR